MKLNNMASRRAFLEQMPTHELDDMLRAELQRETVDGDLVRLLLRVLEEREREHPLEDNEVVAAAVEKYTAYVNSLKTTPARTARKWSGVLKAASILVVVGLLLFALPQAVRAESFFDLLARWTESVFEFFNPAEEQGEQPEYVFETDHPGLQQIYDAVVEMGITDPVVPMWVPEGYELENVKVVEEPTEVTLFANMSCNEKKIHFMLVARGEGPFFNHSKDTNTIETFEFAGVEHYILSNNNKINSTWIINNVECSIVLDCQEDVHKILKSIYTMED